MFATPTASMSASERMACIGSLQFPLKLHVLLQESIQNGKDDIVTYVNQGQGFRIFDKTRFECEIMPLYFKAKTHKSFQRTLNLWGFQTDSYGIIYHQMFLRSQPELCKQMIRVGGVKKQEEQQQQQQDQVDKQGKTIISNDNTNDDTLQQNKIQQQDHQHHATIKIDPAKFDVVKQQIHQNDAFNKQIIRHGRTQQHYQNMNATFVPPHSTITMFPHQIQHLHQNNNDENPVNCFGQNHLNPLSNNVNSSNNYDNDNGDDFTQSLILKLLQSPMQENTKNLLIQTLLLQLQSQQRKEEKTNQQVKYRLNLPIHEGHNTLVEHLLSSFLTMNHEHTTSDEIQGFTNPQQQQQQQPGFEKIPSTVSFLQMNENTPSFYHTQNGAFQSTTTPTPTPTTSTNTPFFQKENDYMMDATARLARAQSGEFFSNQRQHETTTATTTNISNLEQEVKKSKKQLSMSDTRFVSPVASRNHLNKIHKKESHQHRQRQQQQQQQKEEDEKYQISDSTKNQSKRKIVNEVFLPLKPKAKRQMLSTAARSSSSSPSLTEDNLYLLARASTSQQELSLLPTTLKQNLIEKDYGDHHGIRRRKKLPSNNKPTRISQKKSKLSITNLAWEEMTTNHKR